MSDAYEQLTARSKAEWRSWLELNHDKAAGIWLVTFKKGKGPHLANDEVVEEALALGWIDSQRRSLDDARSELLLTPRRKCSRWSKANKERVARLAKAGRMTPAGKAAVEQAKRDGSWTALDKVEALEEPDDLRTALDADERARGYWDAFPRSTKRAILEWILSAKRHETRAKRVGETVEKAAQNIRANQWRQPGGR